MNTIKARFVGGPWHNQVKEVPRLNKLAVIVMHLELYTKSYYHLQQAYSDQVIFFEYVHESVKGWPEEVDQCRNELPMDLINGFEYAMCFLYLRQNPQILAKKL